MVFVMKGDQLKALYLVRIFLAVDTIPLNYE